MKGEANAASEPHAARVALALETNADAAASGGAAFPRDGSRRGCVVGGRLT